MRIRSFRLKLIVSYLFIILVSFGLTIFFLDKRLEKNSLLNIKSSLINQAHLVENQIPGSYIKNEDIAHLDSFVTSLSKRINCRITIITRAGKVLADSEKPENEIPEMFREQLEEKIKKQIPSIKKVEYKKKEEKKEDKKEKK